MATTWYAQLSSVNIDTWAVTQSTVWNDAANGLGNWMQGANFAAGLGAGDILVANGKTGLAINVNVTCITITNLGLAPNGAFTVSTAVTINANVVAGNTTCLTVSGSAPLAVNGGIYGGSGSAAYGLNNTGTSNITITNVGGTALYGGSNTTGIALYNTSTGTVTVYGVVLGRVGCTLYNAGNGNISISGTGNVIAPTTDNTTPTSILNNAGNGNVTITGNVIGGMFNAVIGVTNNGSGSITVSGNVTGGSAPGAYGIVTGSGAITVTGNVTAATASGIASATTGILTINSGNLVNTSAAQAVTSLLPPVYNPGPSNYIRCPQTSGTVDLALEQAANVRSGTPDGDVTGTMAVPVAAQVLYNVPVDNTVGTYVEATPAQVQTGVGFGPNSSYTGTDLPASGPLVGAGGLVE